MKKTVAGILQSRMEKCTKEQFWAIGALTAFGAFLISQKSAILAAELPALAIVLTSAILAGYVAYLVLQRHRAYYALLDQLVDLITTDPSVPESVRKAIKGWKGHKWSGVIFYLACDLVVTVAVLVTYL